MARRLVFEGRQQVRVEEFELPPVGEGEVGLRCLYSLMSTGTEGIAFNRSFEPGSHWDRWVRYPFHPGYTVVADVTSTGQGTTRLAVGDRVCLRLPHSSHGVARAEDCLRVPDGIDAELAPWAKLAQIAHVGAKAADHRLGDTTLIVGAGPIGQMAARWAVAAGCETVVVADRVPSRLALARRGGATAVIEGDIAGARRALEDASGGRLPRVVIDTTGNPAVLPQALEVTARFGRVVLLGDTGTPTQQHLTSDVVPRGLTVVGVHHTHGLHELDGVYRLFFALLLAGRFDMDGMNTHRFRPEACEEAYALANERRGETMGIVFDWT